MMKIKKILLFFIFISALALVNTASAGITVTDAETIYESNLSSVSVPTKPYPVETIFTCNIEAIFKQDLFSVSIPTQPLPVKEIFIINEEATFDTNLYTVSVPTKPSSIEEMFIHLEEAKIYEDLIFPKEFINDTTPPIITHITITNLTNNSVTIKWDTNEIADSLVKYGKVSGIYTESKKDLLFVKNHTIELTGLLPGTCYYFVVNSTDRSENSNESSEYRFATSGASKVFDTCTPADPYPSIFGTHNGTIKPNQTITVSKLYTYPCSGTGGHCEYMKIWNNSDWNVTARWEGYSGDWHNISFDNSFTLEEGETYNYSIRTGSYPQIIHERIANATAGKISCEEFIDVNGKRYDDRIPAIRLE